MRRLLKVLIGVVLAVAVVYLLFTIVFPWVDRALNDPTFDAAPPHTQVASAAT
jgi:hypothetical protein